MSNIKERLVGAITVMDDESASLLWDYVVGLFEKSWDSIEEVRPDQIDLQMIQEAQTDPDCHAFE